MGIEELMANAGTSDWLTEGLSESELRNVRMLSDVSASIELKRKSLGYNQKEFAAYMGVSQGMISKWESGEYNFSLTTLSDICEKLGLDFDPLIREKTYIASDDFKIIPINRGRRRRNKISKNMIFDYSDYEDMANES